MKLEPTLWRTCRVLAGQPRLQLLWHLFEKQELCVHQLSRLTGLSMSNTSTQLRALHARGLISMRRKKMRVIYRAEANSALPISIALLEALRTSYQQNVTFKTISRMATACTHERRIEILTKLKEKPCSFTNLAEITGMSGSALARHLDKLIARNFVQQRNKKYHIDYPGNCFGRTLLKMACLQKQASPA